MPFLFPLFTTCNSQSLDLQTPIGLTPHHQSKQPNHHNPRRTSHHYLIIQSLECQHLCCQGSIWELTLVLQHQVQPTACHSNHNFLPHHHLNQPSHPSLHTLHTHHHSQIQTYHHTVQYLHFHKLHPLILLIHPSTITTLPTEHNPTTPDNTPHGLTQTTYNQLLPHQPTTVPENNFVQSFSRSLKREFPKLDDDNPMGWLRQVEKCFTLDETPLEKRVKFPEAFFTRKVDHWLRGSGIKTNTISWAEFAVLISNRFAAEISFELIESFRNMEQNNNVIAYIDSFDQLMVKLKMQMPS
jgi:hypothetical protein